MFAYNFDIRLFMGFFRSRICLVVLISRGIGMKFRSIAIAACALSLSLAQPALSQQEIEVAKTRLEKAEVRLDIARKQVDAAKARLKAAEAEHKAARANHEAKTLEADAKTLSDASGLPVITDTMIEQNKQESQAAAAAASVLAPQSAPKKKSFASVFKAAPKQTPAVESVQAPVPSTPAAVAPAANVDLSGTRLQQVDFNAPAATPQAQPSAENPDTSSTVPGKRISLGSNWSATAVEPQIVP